MYRVRPYAIALLVIISAFPTTLTVGNAESEDSLSEWGFYVYMAGDNTFYEEVTDDLNEMKMVGSNNNLEIVTLTDQFLGWLL